MAPGLAIPSSRLEHALLEVHVLVDRLDHEIGRSERAEVEGRRQPAHALLHLVHRQAALFGGVLVVAAHDRDAAVERFPRGLDDRDRNAGGEEIHRDPAAHGAGADHPDAADGPRRLVGANVGDLRRLPLGEEHMALRLGLGRREQRHEHVAFLRHALVERQVDRVLHRLDRLLPGLEAAELARVRLADRLEYLGMAARRLELLRTVAHFLERRLLGDEAPGETKRGFMQLAFFGEFVDDAPFLRLARAERRSGQNDVERLLDADEPRQPLRAAGAGNEAELDFGQAAFRRRGGDAIMRGQRHLEPAAERRPVQRRHDRLRGVLDRIEHIRQIGRGGRLAEFGNVGAGDEGASGAYDDDRLDGGVCLRRLDAPLQAVAHDL